MSRKQIVIGIFIVLLGFTLVAASCDVDSFYTTSGDCAYQGYIFSFKPNIENALTANRTNVVFRQCGPKPPGIEIFSVNPRSER